jgi:hypothetical protein
MSRPLPRRLEFYEYLNMRRKKDMAPVDRLKLSLKVAFAVLRFHETPWIGLEFGLSCISLIINYPGNTSLYLKSRLNSESQNQDDTEIFTTSMDTQMSIDRKPPPSPALDKSIYNDLLFRLAQVLTEIGRWTSLPKLRKKNKYLEHDDINLVKELSKDDTFLSQRFSDIIRRCIQCNFGCTTNDLTDRALQRAFYCNVIQPLEEMINVLGPVDLSSA